MRIDWRKLLFHIGLAVGLAIFLQQAWESYRALGQQEFHVVRPLCLLASLALCWLVNLLQMLAWIMIMRYLGVSLGLRQTMQGFLMSFLPRYIPGGVWGYLSRSQWLRQFFGIGYATSIIGSVLESLGLMLTALGAATLFLLGRLADSGRYALLAAAVVLCFALLWPAVPTLVVRLTTFFVPRLVGRFGEAGPQADGSKRGRAWLVWYLAGLIYVALWMAYGGSILFISMAVLPIPSGGLLGAVASIGMAWLLGFVVFFVPMGIGIRELTLSRLLALSLGLVSWQGSLVAVISRLSIVLAEMIWLAFGLLLAVVSRVAGSERRGLARRRE